MKRALVVSVLLATSAAAERRVGGDDPHGSLIAAPAIPESFFHVERFRTISDLDAGASSPVERIGAVPPGGAGLERSSPAGFRFRQSSPALGSCGSCGRCKTMAILGAALLFGGLAIDSDSGDLVDLYDLNRIMMFSGLVLIVVAVLLA